MITKRIPKTWRDLQDNVGAILKQCGFDTKIEETLPSIRGKVEVDVYAEETINARKYSIACECKHWKTRVSQNVVHGFRMQLDDLGCNIGYIISTSGFQSGAIAAIEKTNIELLTWEGFQNTFFESWYENHFYVSLNTEVYLGTDYNLVDWFDDLISADRRVYNDLRNQLHEIEEVKSYFFRPMFDKINRAFKIPCLPLLENLYNSNSYFGNLPDEILVEESFEDFLLKFIIYSKNVISEFEKLDNKYSPGIL